MGIRSLVTFLAGITVPVVIAYSAAATTMTGTFTGTVYDSYDETDFFGLGTGGDTVVGQSISGTFSYIVEDVPADTCGAGYGCYSDNYGVNWLSMSVTVNGVTLAIPTTNTYFQEMRNYDTSVTGGYDVFLLYDSHTLYADDPSAGMAEYYYDYVSLAFFSYLVEFALGEGVPTASFAWITDGGFNASSGTTFWTHWTFDYNSGAYLDYVYAYAYWNLESLTLQVSTVPEPGTFALIAPGLLGIAWRSYRVRRRV